MTRKITLALANIAAGKQEKLSLGNMDAKRDWGFAGDYVEGMRKILQNDVPGDFVLATNETHTVRQFVEEACRNLGIEIRWEGKGVKKRVTMQRPESCWWMLILNFTARQRWNFCGEIRLRRKRSLAGSESRFKGLVAMMMDADLKAVTGMSCQEYREGKQQ